MATAIIRAQLEVTCYLRAIFSSKAFHAQAFTFHAYTTLRTSIGASICSIAIYSTERRSTVATPIFAYPISAAVTRALGNLRTIVSRKTWHTKTFVILAYTFAGTSFFRHTTGALVVYWYAAIFTFVRWQTEAFPKAALAIARAIISTTG